MRLLVKYINVKSANEIGDPSIISSKKDATFRLKVKGSLVTFQIHFESHLSIDVVL